MTTTYSYDAQGQVRSVAGPSQTVTYSYDAAANRTQMTSVNALARTATGAPSADAATAPPAMQPPPSPPAARPASPPPPPFPAPPPPPISPLTGQPLPAAAPSSSR